VSSSSYDANSTVYIVLLIGDNEVEAAAALDAVLTEAHLVATAGGAVDAAAASAVGPATCSPPRHPTQLGPSFY